MAKQVNYKYYNRAFMSGSRKADDVLDSVKFTRNYDVLFEAKHLWDELHGFRVNRRRNGLFTFGGQWKDKIPDPDRLNRLIVEEDAIRRQGRAPLKCNLIRKLTKSVVGQFRNAKMEPIAVVRDSDETKIGEMMSIALQACYQLNQASELDAEMLQEYLISSSAFQKVKYDIIPTRDVKDGYIENKNPARMFWSRMEDSRGWDLQHIGEIHDLRIAEILRAFAGNDRGKALRIREIYSGCSDEYLTMMNSRMDTRRIDSLDFLCAPDPATCRVIESWRLESKAQLLCHDYLDGSLNWADEGERKNIDAENAYRIQDAAAHGVSPENVLLIDYEWTIRKYWYFRFFAPSGEVLMEGESPYWHSGHPYVFRFHSVFDGKAHSFVEDVIDQQKMINRMYILNDFVISSGAKNAVFVDSDALDGKAIEDVAESYVKVGSVTALKPKAGKRIQDVIHSFSSNNTNIGTYEMINLMTEFINDISGVHGALRGEKPAAGTPASLYEQETQNASINLVDVLNSFNTFRTDRDIKLMKVIQQYYDSKRYLNVAGKDYDRESRYYDPEKVRNAEMDISLSQSTGTASYRNVMDAFLMELMRSGAITLKMFLENTSLPFKDKLMQSLIAEEESIQAGMGGMAAAGGMPPEMMAQVQQMANPEGMSALRQGMQGG
jgi:hypothetical protein